MTELRRRRLRVNGRDAWVSVPDRCTLADALREPLELTSVRIGCEQGVCGACTVLLDGQAIRSCLMLAAQAEDRDVETVEGLSRDGRLSRLQRAFTEHEALQCGFCTSGFLMLAEGFLREEHGPTDACLRELVAANLCRCTGYEPIVRAIIAASASAADTHEV